MSNRVMQVRRAPADWPSIVRHHRWHAGLVVRGRYEGLYRLRSGQIVRAFPRELRPLSQYPRWKRRSIRRMTRRRRLLIWGPTDTFTWLRP